MFVFGQCLIFGMVVSAVVVAVCYGLTGVVTLLDKHCEPFARFVDRLVELKEEDR